MRRVSEPGSVWAPHYSLTSPFVQLRPGKSQKLAADGEDCAGDPSGEDHVA